ncbi:MAG: SusC/RagA family TonB-linked outer membrane protein [Flavobacteriaceae bacterium]|nr:SusC/RagA family TonB-linked outer membrane protein [Flavobacteriaceae bacterium]
MKTKQRVFWTLLLAFMVQLSFAQDKTVKGVVSDASGPLPGVTVMVKGTHKGTQTDFDGKYTVKTQKGDILFFSYIGMKPVYKKVGASNVMNITMHEDAEALGEVVVTAMGISRDEQSIAFSTQGIDSEQLGKVKQSDAISALSGKAAGVQISTGSSMAGSSRILIRGANSITGENQPLFVVDGVPMDNANYNSTGAQAGYGGIDYGNMLNDLNPDDIESISILKGASAALYGSRASNGVVMITTKGAKGQEGKIRVDLSTGVEFEQVSGMPDLQREYGGGSYVPSDKGGVDGFSQVTIDGKKYKIADYGTDESWGPKYNANVKYLPWYAFDKQSFPNDYLKEVPWVAPKNDVESFFQLGHKVTNSVGVSKSSANYGIRFGYTNTKVEGFVPNSKQMKNNISLKGNVKFLDNKLVLQSGLNFMRQKTNGRPTFGYSSNSFSQKFFQWGQRQLDFNKLRQYKNIDGSQRSWNRSAWNDATPHYSDNPYWTVFENYGDDERDRLFGNVSLTWNISEDLSLKGSAYGDTYTFYNRERSNVGSQAQSFFSETVRNNYEYNYELIMNYTKNLTDDFNVSALLGANKRISRYYRNYGETSGGLIVKSVWNLNNSSGTVSVQDFTSEKEVNSVFASASFGFKKLLYLDVTARNDWSSTLPNEHNSFFYPSASLAFLFSKLTDAEWLSFGKLRLGWSQVGSDTSPYRVNGTYNYDSDGPFHGYPRLSAGSKLFNKDLKPELTTTVEGGVDLKFFNNRLGLSVTYYKNNTTDQIIPLEISKTTGYSSKYINAGEMENKGIEITLDATPVKTDNFTWDIGVNFSKNSSKLVSLYKGLTELQIVSAPFKGAYLMAKEGESYGQLTGYDFLYDKEGNKVLSDKGAYLRTKSLVSLGSVLPDFNVGVRNNFTYKNLDFGFLIDIQKGGKFYSVTHMWGMYSGMLGETAQVNDRGNNIRESVKDGGGIKPEGVTGKVDWKDGKYTVTDAKPFDKYVSGKAWSQRHYHGYGTPSAQSVFDASYIKLREVNVGYTLPKMKLGFIKNIRVSLYGKNLATFGLALKGFDPETTVGGSGNIQGIEGGFIPATRSYGFNVQFGF